MGIAFAKEIIIDPKRYVENQANPLPKSSIQRGIAQLKRHESFEINRKTSDKQRHS